MPKPLTSSDSDEDSIDYTKCNRLESDFDENSVDYTRCNRLESHEKSSELKVQKSGIKRRYTESVSVRFFMFKVSDLNQILLFKDSELDVKKCYTVAGVQTSVSMYKVIEI